MALRLDIPKTTNHSEPVWHQPDGRRYSWCAGQDEHAHVCRNDLCPFFRRTGLRLAWKHDACSGGSNDDHRCPECGVWNGYRLDGKPDV